MTTPEEIFRWQDLDIQLGLAFSPSTAIRHRDLFRGRLAYIRRVVDAVNQVGRHAVIYGERGVGKSSLANNIASFLAPFSSEEIVSVRVNCNQTSSFDSIWRALFRQLELTVPDKYDRITPDDVLLLMPEQRKVIMIIDEFDRIQDPDVDTAMADTIKAFSDFGIDSTLILVGVADDVDDLIAEHESIARCLSQIHLDRMTIPELSDIVTHGFRSVGMTALEQDAREIAALSLGLPHYTHSLSLSAGRAAIDEHSMNVSGGHIDLAVEAILADTEQSSYRQFIAATKSPRRENYYFQVLLACALANIDDLGYFYAQAVREPFSRIMKKNYEIPAFSKHLHRLSEPDRGEVLKKEGESHSFRYRFTDPQMQPFMLMQGIKRELITMDDLPVREPRQGQLFNF